MNYYSARKLAAGRMAKKKSKPKKKKKAKKKKLPPFVSYEDARQKKGKDK